MVGNKSERENVQISWNSVINRFHWIIPYPLLLHVT